MTLDIGKHFIGKAGIIPLAERCDLYSNTYFQLYSLDLQKMIKMSLPLAGGEQFGLNLHNVIVYLRLIHT